MGGGCLRSSDITDRAGVDTHHTNLESFRYAEDSPDVITEDIRCQANLAAVG
jgi:hypothetical protein